jgi:hypothetical protein
MPMDLDRFGEYGEPFDGTNHQKIHLCGKLLFGGIFYLNTTMQELPQMSNDKIFEAFQEGVKKEDK